MYRTTLIAAALLLSPPVVAQEEGVQTLYQSTVFEPNGRIHVASFDSVEGATFNQMNCALVAELLHDEVGSRARFWCEPGPYDPDP